MEFVFSVLSVVCYLGLLLGVLNVVGSVCGCSLHFYSTKYHRQQPLYNTLEILVMGIVVPETC